MPLESFEGAEQELREKKGIGFALWFIGRLVWTYIKSVLGFFMPNTSFFFVAGVILSLLSPNSIPQDWISLMLGGSAFLFILWASIVGVFRLTGENVEVHFRLWATLTLVFGIFAAIPYIRHPSDNPAFFINSYVVFTFIVVPFVFMFRRTRIILLEMDSLRSKTVAVREEKARRRRVQMEHEALEPKKQTEQTISWSYSCKQLGVTNSSECKHERTGSTTFTVGGEPRRVVWKCLDCGEIVKTEPIGR